MRAHVGSAGLPSPTTGAGRSNMTTALRSQAGSAAQALHLRARLLRPGSRHPETSWRILVPSATGSTATGEPSTSAIRGAVTARRALQESLNVPARGAPSPRSARRASWRGCRQAERDVGSFQRGDPRRPSRSGSAARDHAHRRFRASFTPASRGAARRPTLGYPQAGEGIGAGRPWPPLPVADLDRGLRYVFDVSCAGAPAPRWRARRVSHRYKRNGTSYGFRDAWAIGWDRSRPIAGPGSGAPDGRGGWRGGGPTCAGADGAATRAAPLLFDALRPRRVRAAGAARSAPRPDHDDPPACRRLCVTSARTGPKTIAATAIARPRD